MSDICERKQDKLTSVTTPVEEYNDIEEDYGSYQKSSFIEFGKRIEREFNIDLGIEEYITI